MSMLRTFARLLCFLVCIPGVATCAVAADSSDDVLVSSREVTLTRGDYEAALARIPEENRKAFAMSADRLTSFVNNLLVTRTLAERARKAGLAPETGMPVANANDIERALAAAQLRVIDAAADRAFDARRDGFAAAARETYLLNGAKYARPEQVRVSAILISSEGRGSDGALSRAKATRDKLVAWADFAAVAREVSDDKASAANGGQLDWRSADELDPELAKAAFALKVGEISPPIAQANGYALIRVDERRPAGKRPFDEVKPEILTQLRAEYIARSREAVDQAIRNDPTLKVNQQALDSLIIRVDPALFRPSQTGGGGSVPAPAAR